jgi:hypothetical protein
MKDFGNSIYAFGCVVAATVLGIGVADYWFGHHELTTFLSWAVLAVIPWLVGFASSYVLARIARPIAPATRREGLRPITAKLPELLGRKD